MNKPLVSIVIVNYKQYDHLRKCLRSVYLSSYQNFEILVIDNESDHSGLLDIKRDFPLVHYFPHKENLHYAEGNNLGISHSKGDYIVILNNDTIVHENWLEPLVEAGQENPEALYQPVIYFMDRPNTVNSMGNTTHLFGFAYPLELGKEFYPADHFNKMFEVFYCSGACIFAAKKVLEKLGNLDSNYWTYYEDVNLGWKARMCGYPSYVILNSAVYHVWGGTYGQEISSNKLYLLERGRLSSILRNFSIRTLAIILPFVLILDIIMMIYLLRRKGLIKAKISSSIDVLLNVGTIYVERKKIQSLRTLTDKEVAKKMSTTIDHPYFGEISLRWVKTLSALSKGLMKLI
jgi:GT2 family glycosyltransferase